MPRVRGRSVGGRVVGPLVRGGLVITGVVSATGGRVVGPLVRGGLVILSVTSGIEGTVVLVGVLLVGDVILSTGGGVCLVLRLALGGVVVANGLVTRIGLVVVIVALVVVLGPSIEGVPSHIGASQPLRQICQKQKRNFTE